jgi:ferredoxin
MTYLVVDNCIKCKHTDCVSVCPVDCFYEGEDMLVINPDECIDCGVCVPECPADAIVADSDLEGSELIKWMDINSTYSQEWPNITEYKGPLPDWEQHDQEPNKYEKYFTPIGEGKDFLKDDSGYDN